MALTPKAAYLLGDYMLLVFGTYGVTWMALVIAQAYAHDGPPHGKWLAGLIFAMAVMAYMALVTAMTAVRIIRAWKPPVEERP